MQPVYPFYFADPFVLRVEGAYYAYGTGAAALPDGRAFEVLRSENLRDWVSLGGALERIEPGFGTDYWAPEVALEGGRFYLYYSVGMGDKSHKIRVAVSEKPEGPFRDAGVELTPDEPFAIDSNPFRDGDGSWYLFYAKDFLEGERAGTALAVRRMRRMVELGAEAHTVLRASADWQIYQRSRRMYGKTYDWHTLEGPFVVRRNGLYYCFYSGGNWQEHTYGVGYATAEHPLGPWREPHAGPTVLRTVPGRLIGPGHNSLVRGPDGQDYLIFHAWDAAQTARRMFVERLLWTAEGPRLEAENADFL